MPDHPLTVGDVRTHAATLGAMASALLTGLATGKYDSQAAFVESMLDDMSIVFPPTAAVAKGLEVFLAINTLTAPRAPIVLAGDGVSWVPDSNSRYDPATGEFL